MRKRFIAAILFNIFLFTELGISSEGKGFSSMRSYCQWEPTKCKSRNHCMDQCGKFKGFTIPDSDQLVCFHFTKVALLISLLDEETKSKQCGDKSSRKTDRGRACNPKISCENETDDQCSEKCSKNTVFITKSDRKYISYCGEISKIEPIMRTLDATGNYLYVPRDDGTQRYVYNCSCGIGEEGKEVEESTRARKIRIQPNENPPNEMVAACPNVSLKYDKLKCETSCENLHGIYSPEDNKFICFHKQKNVTMLQATAEYCECQADADGIAGQLLSNSECPPERRIQLNNEDVSLDCPQKCANYKAYIYSTNDEDQFAVYCEFPSYIFKNLSYQLGNTVVVDNKKGKKYRMLECTCGLRLSQSEINSKINAFSINNGGRDKVANSLQIRNHSDIRSDEMPISDSQSFFEKWNTIQNEEIDNLLKDSEFIHDLIQGGENTTNNNNNNHNDSNIPIAGKKRTSREMNDENYRGKEKDIQIQRFDEIEQPAEDLEIPLTCQHAASPNNSTHIASSSSSKIPKLFDLNYIQIDEDTFQHFFTGPFSMSCHHTLQNASHNRGLIRSNTTQYVGLSRNTIQNTRVGPSLIQNRELTYNNTSQSMGVINLTEM